GRAAPGYPFLSSGPVFRPDRWFRAVVPHSFPTGSVAATRRLQKFYNRTERRIRRRGHQPSRQDPAAMTTAASAEPKAGQPHGSLAALALGALGVVYGDIGTSPLYTVKTVLDWEGASGAPEVALGAFSLIVWTLIITTSVKYVIVVMRADNEGEGGILALMSLLGLKHGTSIAVVSAGILGAALLYGDGAITPAISVLSALEGLKTAAPAIAPWVVSLA